jgi:hypothetical protein
MRRSFGTLAAASALMLTLALGASPALAAGSPLTHMTYPASLIGSICGYTPQSGTITEVFRNANVVDGVVEASHATLHDIWATNEAGAWFHMVGSETYNDLKGHLTLKVVFVAKGGGVADTINVVFRSNPDGSPHVSFERDSCHLYG